MLFLAILIITAELNRTFLGLGTEVHFRIAVDGECTEERAGRLVTLAYREIKRIELSLSRWSASSLITEINRNAGIKPVKIPPELRSLLFEITDLHKRTEGAFDITVCPLILLWNVTERKVPPSPEEVRRALSLTGMEKVVLRDDSVYLPLKGMCFDTDGFLKGYAGDRASDFLLNGGCRSFTLKIGGSIFIRNSPVTLFIPPPREHMKGLKVEISDGAVATSGDYTRFFIYNGQRYHDLIEPRTGYPAKGCISATVISGRGLISDVLATAIAIRGEKGLKYAEELSASALCIREDGRIFRTSSFPPYYSVEF